MHLRLSIVIGLTALLAVSFLAGCSNQGDTLTAPGASSPTPNQDKIDFVTNVVVHYNSETCMAVITWETWLHTDNDKVIFGEAGGPYKSITASPGKYHSSEPFNFSSLPGEWDFLLEGELLFGHGGTYEAGPFYSVRPLCLGGK